MTIKTFILIIYSLLGLLISVITAFATVLIIGKPIGSKMVFEIMFTVISVLPIIGISSYFLGKFLSKKFNFIKYRLENIKSGNFMSDDTKSLIYEIDEINKNMNFLSSQLNNLISDLKLKNSNLSNLLVSIAHDVKTPITILNGYIEEIEDNLISKENLPLALKHMKDEIIFIDELTIEILDFIVSMKSDKIKTDINFFNLINDDIFTILPKVDNITYINNLEKDFIINFNKADLKKICLNIFSNAIKHTKNGYLKIYNKDEAIIFENNGTKIDNELKDKIFEPFFTIDKNKMRKTSGFGLGLSIVKNLSINNNYDCFLKDTSDNKTLFYLTTKNL